MTRIEGYVTMWRNEIQHFYRTEEEAEKGKRMYETVKPQVFWVEEEKKKNFQKTGKF